MDYSEWLAPRKAQAEPEGGAFWQDAPDYHGALVAAGDMRLAISPNGKRYLLQLRQDDGSFRVAHWRKTLAKLAPYLPAAMAAEKIAELPDNPLDVHRPWAVHIQRQGQRVRRALLSADEYAGVIARSGDVRLAIAPQRQKYVLQVRDKAGRWRGVASSVARGPIFDLVFSRLHPEHKAAAVSRNPALMNAVAKLPERASFYRDARVERLTDALAAARRGDAPQKTVARTGAG